MSLKPKKVEFVEVWDRIQETVQIVISGGSVRRAVWNDRFSDVYALCVANPDPLSDKLYESTKNFFETHVKDILSVSVLELNAYHQIFFNNLYLLYIVPRSFSLLSLWRWVIFK